MVPDLNKTPSILFKTELCLSVSDVSMAPTVQVLRCEGSSIYIADDKCLSVWKPNLIVLSEILGSYLGKGQHCRGRIPFHYCRLCSRLLRCRSDRKDFHRYVGEFSPLLHRWRYMLTTWPTRSSFPGPFRLRVDANSWYLINKANTISCMYLYYWFHFKSILSLK